MTLAALVRALSEPTAYPFPADTVEVHHTHLSVVFVAGNFAYKLKKPVHLGFVDFSTIEQRRWFCHEEVRLNRRLAPHVYLGVVAITRAGSGVQVEGLGELIEWAVKMARMPAEACLEHLLDQGRVDEGTIDRLAVRVASFHAQAEGGPRIAETARLAVFQNAFDNFDHSRSHIGITISQEVHARLQKLNKEWLERLGPLIEARALAGKPRDTHGDLRLEHVYLFPKEPPPGDIVIVDCIEFNERYRHADPIADMAFPVMDLIFHGELALARTFVEAYFRASGDEEGRALLPFYVAYRAAVRAKVEGMENEEAEVPAYERKRVRNQARAHWLLALGELEEARARPALVIVGGLPGSGKSTLALGLAERAGLEVIRSDLVRKESIAGSRPASAGYQEAKYTQEGTRAIYEECLRRADKLLFQGKRVLVDATFRANEQRRAFLDVARRWSVPAVLLVCQAEPEAIRRRLAERRGDASDADWAVYLRLAEEWEPAAAGVVPTYLGIGASREQVVGVALQTLAAHGLY